MIGPQIKLIREALGLGVQAFADAINVDASYIGRIEKGSRTPSNAVLRNIDAIAAEAGIESNLATEPVFEFETVSHVHHFFANPTVSEARKEAVSRLILTLLRMQ